MFVSKVQFFSVSLLVCEFHNHGQTWYQKFIGTYPPLSLLVTTNMTGSCLRTNELQFKFSALLRYVAWHKFIARNVSVTICFQPEKNESIYTFGGRKNCIDDDIPG